MSHGYTSVPQDEAESAPPPVSLGDRARSWWARKFGSSDAERAPLLDRNKMTLEPPKKSTRKVILSVIFIIAALIVLGFSLGFWLDDDESCKSRTHIHIPFLMHIPFIIEQRSRQADPN